MYDTIIIGQGPAAISAALYISRANFSTLIIAKGNGSLEKAERIDNYYGLLVSLSGIALLEAGIEQAKKFGVNFIIDEVLSLTYNDSFTVTTKNGSYSSKTVLLATGSSRKKPPIAGIRDFEGKGVSYCAVCDAFFYKNKSVGVLGNGDFALHEAIELASFTDKITIFTNTQPVIFNEDKRFNINTKKIIGLSGENKIEQILFDDNSNQPIDGLFIALGTAGAADFAKVLGVEVNGDRIVVDERQKTNLPGLFAAGDCTGGTLQVSVAVGEGAKAGLEIINTLRNINSK